MRLLAPRLGFDRISIWILRVPAVDISAISSTVMPARRLASRSADATSSRERNLHFTAFALLEFVIVRLYPLSWQDVNFQIEPYCHSPTFVRPLHYTSHTDWKVGDGKSSEPLVLLWPDRISQMKRHFLTWLVRTAWSYPCLVHLWISHLAHQAGGPHFMQVKGRSLEVNKQAKAFRMT